MGPKPGTGTPQGVTVTPKPGTVTVMVRPKLGADARTQSVTVKVTAAEAVTLTEQYGSAGKGLRALLDDHLLPYPPPIDAGVLVVPDDLPVTQDEVNAAAHDLGIAPPLVRRRADVPDVLNPLEWSAADEVSGDPPHRHRRDTFTGVTYENGAPVRLYRCACGEELR